MPTLRVVLQRRGAAAAARARHGQRPAAAAAAQCAQTLRHAWCAAGLQAVARAAAARLRCACVTTALQAPAPQQQQRRRHPATAATTGSHARGRKAGARLHRRAAPKVRRRRWAAARQSCESRGAAVAATAQWRPRALRQRAAAARRAASPPLSWLPPFQACSCGHAERERTLRQLRHHRRLRRLRVPVGRGGGTRRVSAISTRNPGFCVAHLLRHRGWRQRRRRRHDGRWWRSCRRRGVCGRPAHAQSL